MSHYRPELAHQALAYAAVHGPRGTYTFLCCTRTGIPFYAHHPVATVLYHWA